jgi:peptidoglycan/LPS O-acetylase OafA/YrhL
MSTASASDTHSANDVKRVPELDGFRALAVSMVFIAHICYGSRLPPDALDWMPSFSRALISHGWLGVDLFFILSGFLISGILMDSKESAHYFRNFYARRTLRIIPLYLACIVVMWLSYDGFSSYFRLSLLFLANFSYYFRIAEPHGPGVLWSLAVEEHFYLMWPLFVYLLNRRQLLVLALSIVIGAPILRGLCTLWGMDPELEIYMYSFFRFDGLALGAILAILVRSSIYSRNRALLISGGLAAASLLLTIIGTPYGIMEGKSVASSALRYTQAELVFAALLTFALAYRGTPVTAVLRAKAVRFISDRSYCIYLIHLCLVDLYLWTMHRLRTDDVAVLGAARAVMLRFTLIAVVTIVISSLTKKYLEDPFLRLKRLF